MTGDELTRAIACPPSLAPPLIADFLYPKTVTMITGEAGKGKTVICTQMAFALTSATPLFGQLTIPTPQRVYFLQAEGSWDNQLRRLHVLAQVVPFDGHRLYWDAQRTSRVFALSRPSVDRKLQEMADAFAPHPPEVVILDPIYKVAGGDLAKAEPALALVEFSDRILREFGATVVFMHHPHREKRENGRLVEEDDAYYGHSFLRNHVEVAYFFKQLTSDGLTSELRATKRREDDVRSTFHLCYHPETYSCSMLPELPHARKVDQLRAYLLECAQRGQTTTFKELKARVSIGDSYLRELQAEWVREGLLSLQPDPGKPTLWIPLLPKVSAERCPPGVLLVSA